MRLAIHRDSPWRGCGFLPPTLLGQAGFKPDEADNGAVTLIQRFGSAANLNIHLHCRVLDGVHQRGTDGRPEFVEAPAPTDRAPQAVLHKIITRTMKLLTRRGGWSRSMNSSGDMARCVVPSHQGVFNLSTTCPAALVCTRSLASAGRVM